MVYYRTAEELVGPESRGGLGDRIEDDVVITRVCTASQEYINRLVIFQVFPLGRSLWPLDRDRRWGGGIRERRRKTPLRKELARARGSRSTWEENRTREVKAVNCISQAGLCLQQLALKHSN